MPDSTENIASELPSPQIPVHKTLWYESNLFWSPLTFAGGIILAVVAAMKQDLRWLLWFAWPLFTLSAYAFSRGRRYVKSVTIVAALITGGAILLLAHSLRPQTSQASAGVATEQTSSGTPGGLPPVAAASTVTVKAVGPKIDISPTVKISPTKQVIPDKPASSPTTPPTTTQPSLPTYQQQCVGSACAQGPGATAIYNQYGALRLVMTGDQQNAIRDAMKQFAGEPAGIACQTAEDVSSYAYQLYIALHDAGMSPNEPLCSINLVERFPIPSGISLLAGSNRLKGATAFSTAMEKAGLVAQKLPIHDDEKYPDNFVIFVTSNR